MKKDMIALKMVSMLYPDNMGTYPRDETISYYYSSSLSEDGSSVQICKHYWEKAPSGKMYDVKEQINTTFNDLYSRVLKDGSEKDKISLMSIVLGAKETYE